MEEPLPLFVKAVFFNFYALLSLLILLVAVSANINLGPMAKAENREKSRLEERGGEDAVGNEGSFTPS